jgi:hypothetical protein
MTVDRAIGSPAAGLSMTSGVASHPHALESELRTWALLGAGSLATAGVFALHESTQKAGRKQQFCVKDVCFG